MTMKWTSGGMKSPLSRARGLGSAKSGSHHWMMQRVTAVSNAVLGLWFVWSVLTLANADYAIVRDWLAAPVNAILMILFVISSFYHAVLGLQVVTEDYVHCEGLKVIKLMGQKLLYTGLGVACVFAVLKVAL